MNRYDLQNRTKAFSLNIIKNINQLPYNQASKIICNQILSSSTSVAANYRAACRARSKAEFIAKIGIVIEEADECSFWLEFLHESGFINQQLFHILHN